MAPVHITRLRVISAVLAASQLLGGIAGGYSAGQFAPDFIALTLFGGVIVGLIGALMVSYLFSAAIYLVQTAESNAHGLSRLKAEMSSLAPRIRDLVVETLEDDD